MFIIEGNIFFSRFIEKIVPSSPKSKISILAWNDIVRSVYNKVKDALLLFTKENKMTCRSKDVSPSWLQYKKNRQKLEKIEQHFIKVSNQM